MNDSEWVTVGGNNKPRKSAKKAPAAAQKTSTLADESQSAMPGWEQISKQGKPGSDKRGKRKGASTNWQLQAVNDARTEVAGSKMYQNLLAAFQSMEQHAGNDGEEVPACSRSLTEAHELVIYGLGTLEAGNVTPRYQLGLALLLAERHLRHLLRPAQLFDPVFTEEDRDLLVSLGCEVIGFNEGGARSVGSTVTFFYLPHCEASLCNALLAANWSQDQLGNIIILGNSFQTICDRWDFRTAATEQVPPRHIINLVKQGLVEEIPVADNKFSVPSAFNDMSLHFFPKYKLAQAESSLWDLAI